MSDVLRWAGLIIMAGLIVAAVLDWLGIPRRRCPVCGGRHPFGPAHDTDRPAQERIP